MFEYYTFGAPARQPDPPSRDVSPHDTSCSPSDLCLPTNPSSQHAISEPLSAMLDIVAKLEGQDLRCDSVRMTIEQSSRPTSRVGGGGSSSLSCRRYQRQIHTQLQCSSSHMRSIASLVDDMLSSGSQCTITRPRHTNSRTPSPSPPARPSYLVIEDHDTLGLALDEASSPEAEHDTLSLPTSASLRSSACPAGIRKYSYGTYRTGTACVAKSSPSVQCTPRVRRGAVMRKPTCGSK